jgi:hypothetical protein
MDDNDYIMNTRIYPQDTNKKECVPMGLSKYMDCILINKKKIFYNKNLQDVKTIFINMRYPSYEDIIIFFIKNILPTIKNKINIIIAGEDHTFPNSIDIRSKKKPSVNDIKKYKDLIHHKFIHKIFVENLDEHIHNNVIPIPLGIDSRHCPPSFQFFLQFENINEKKPLKITNFNMNRTMKGQWEERGKVWNLCNNEWKNYFIETKNLKNDKYLKKMGDYWFTICVHGGGIDPCPKVFDALLIGVIPIIKKNNPLTTLYEDLPIVIVDDWDILTINEKKLNEWYEKYKYYFLNKDERKKILYKLSMNYWLERINNLS